MKILKLICFFVASTLFICGCRKSEIEVNFKNRVKKVNPATITNIKVVNHQLILTGTNLDRIRHFKIKEGSTETVLNIESSTVSTLVANTQTNVVFAAGRIFEFILSDANAGTSFTVNFSLCDSTLNGKAFDCSIVPQNKYVLTYNGVNQSWEPQALNGLVYVGVADANALPSSGGAGAIGEYYIIGTAGGAYAVGDWAVDNGVTLQHVPNPNTASVLTVHGRIGAIVGAKNDYNLNQMSDVNLAGKAIGDFLKYDGVNWVPSALTYTETDPSVTAFAKAALPSCGAGQVLKSNGTSLSCVTDNTGTSFTGTASRAVVTDGAGTLVSSPISITILNYLSNVTSDIQTQINAKLNSSSFVDWSTSGVQTIDPTRLNLTTANRVIVTNASSNPIASAVTSTELGYLTGVTSSIQAQLNSKLSSYTETDPGVTAFAKAALPTCNAGEVLKGNGTSLSCVTDNAGGGAYVGTLNRVVLTDGATGALTVSSVTNIEAGYLSGVTSAIQTQLNAKQAIITSASSLTSGSIQTNLQNAVEVYPYNTAAGNTGEFRFYELAANGTNYTGFKSPDLLGANIIYTMPETAPNTGEVLSSTAGGVLSWIAIPSAPVTSVNSLTGAVTLTTTNIAEGTNLYHTDARARTATVADGIADAVTNIAPSQNAVFDALALKLNSGSFIEWDQSGVQTMDPSRLNLGVPNAGKAVVTDGSGFIITSSATATELSYLSGVTSAIQTQLNTKQDISTLASDVRSIVLTGISTGTNAVISAADSILSAFGKLQSQISAQSLNKADLTNAAQSITASNINTTSINGGNIPDLSKAITNEGGAPSIQIGTLAGRPAAVAGNTGRMYVANDSGNESIYVSTGATWIQVASNGLSGTVPIANGGTGATSFTANKIVVVNGGATSLIDGPSLDDVTAAAATVVKRGPSGEVYGQVLSPTSTVTESSACTTLGAISKDANGNILSCQN